MFALDGFVVLVAGWLLARAAGHATTGTVETGVAWLLACVAIVAGTSAVLGETGGFSPLGFLAGHLALGAALAIGRRKHLAADLAAARGWARNGLAVVRTSPERGLIWVLLGIMAVHLAISIFAPLHPYDSLTYRLPRIAHWLQEGRVGHLLTDDDRLNYMPVGPDLVVAWLIGSATRGFALAGLAQYAGGWLLLGATWLLARRTGLGPRASLGAVALVLGMANVAPQISSLHTDLFAAGLLVAGAALWLQAWERGSSSWLAGAGLGFAAAAKGTVIYVAPALVLWAWWFAWPARARWRQLLPLAAAGTLALLLVAGPMWRRNHETYGRLSAPEHAVLGHYGPKLGLADRLEKLAINVRTSAVQLLDPNSQPLWLRGLIEPQARAAASALPGRDRFCFEDVHRAETMQIYFGMSGPHPDFAGPGLTLIGFVLAGAVAAAVRWRRTGAKLVLLWFAGIVLYVITQNALFQWHPWGMRYAVLIAPWLAIVAAWLVQDLPRFARVVGWTLLLTNAGWSAIEAVTWRGDNLVQSLRFGRDWSLGSDRGWAATLGPESSGLRLALPGNRASAAFFRAVPGRRVRTEKLSEVAPRELPDVLAEHPQDWLVVPASTFLGREGQVEARALIVGGDAANRLSLAAYRLLPPGVTPPPVIYAIEPLSDGSGYRVVLRAWQKETDLELENGAAIGWRFDIGGQVTGVLPPGGRIGVRLGTAADRVTLFLVRFTPQAGGETDEPFPHPTAVRAVTTGP
jgi:4-amino-4-deoxy-L-arabinose transferase-like glycosyltransferase